MLRTSTTWVAKKLSAPSLSLSSQRFTPFVPLMTRRVQHDIVTRRATHSASSCIRHELILARWKKNISRLYARYIFDLAVVAAATAVFKTQLEHGVTVQEQPADWQNWEQKDWTEELLSSLGASKLERFWSAVRRVVSLSVLAAPMTVLLPLSYVSESARQVSWEYALWGIEQAGPTFIKLVQWATTRQDLFSPEFCQYFGKLRDETIGHAWKETVRILQEELGPTAAEAIALEHTPIGSGCIAQVYRGKLTQAVGKYPSGTEVAVKVQHPHIWQKVCVDFYIMSKVARFLEGLPYLNLEFLSLDDTVRQFRDIMLPQLNLTLEAKHLQRFNRDFSDNERVSFPYPLNELTSTRVLTETFLHGRPIIEFVQAPEAVRKELAGLGLETTLQMIFLHDFLHGDLHPGNILVGKTDRGHYKLQLLDCGLVVEMGPDQHVNLVKVLGAFTRRKGRLAGQLMVDVDNKCQAGPVDMELFIQGIEAIVKEDENNNFIEKVGDYIADICFLACKHHVKLESAFIKAALSVEIMEGIASALYPSLTVTTVALPLIVKAEMMHRLPKFSLW